jgi:hypothetical protein
MGERRKLLLLLFFKKKTTDWANPNRGVKAGG